MKTITTLLLAVLLCGSAFAADTKAALTDTFSKKAEDIGAVWAKLTPKPPCKKDVDSLIAYHAKLAGGDKKISYQDLFTAYATGDDQQARFVISWIKAEDKSAALLSALDAEIAALVKAKSPHAPTVQRARDKFARQLTDTALLQDAQAAVADALKALEVKS